MTMIAKSLPRTIVVSVTEASLSVLDCVGGCYSECL